MQMPRRVLKVRTTKLKGQNKGNRMSPESTERSNQMVEDVKAINDYLSSFTFTGMVFDGLRRSFNKGTEKNLIIILVAASMRWRRRLYWAEETQTFGNPHQW